MRGFGRILLLFGILLIVTPFALGAIALANDQKMPSYLEEFNYQTFDLEAELNAKKQEMMMSQLIGEAKLELDQVFITKALHAQFKGYEAFKINFPQLNDRSLVVRHVWITLDNQVFTLVMWGSFGKMDTTITAKLEVTDLDGATKINFKSVKVGKLPIPKSLFMKTLTELEESGTINPNYQHGELNLKQLYLTINDEWMNEQVKGLGSDLLLFEKIQMDDAKLSFNFILNPNNQEAVAIQQAMNEVKLLVTSKKQAVKDGINAVLDESNPQEQQAKADLNVVIDLLGAKVSGTQTTEFTTHEWSQIDALKASFSELSTNKQEAVANELINQMDPTNKQTIENLLSQSGTGSLADLISQFLGGK